MSDRVEEIRRRHADDLAMLAKNPRLVEKEWSDHPESWQDTADVRDLLAALAQAEADLARVRAEVERLRGELQDEHLAYVGCTREQGETRRRELEAEVALARVRAALEKAHGMMAGAMWKDGQIHVCDDSCFIWAALEGR